jgi:hypothetical protein
MAALDWQTTRDAVLAALTGKTGPTLKAGERIRGALDNAGADYAARYSAAESAKTAWLVKREQTHLQADRACRYAESLLPHGANAPLPFDPTSNDDAIKVRCRAAIAESTSRMLKTLLEGYVDDVATAYSGDAFGAWTRGTMRQQWFADPRAVAEYLAARRGTESTVLTKYRLTAADMENAIAGRTRAVPDKPAMRDRETELRTLIASGDEWLALVSYA